MSAGAELASGEEAPLSLGSAGFSSPEVPWSLGCREAHYCLHAKHLWPAGPPPRMSCSSADPVAGTSRPEHTCFSPRRPVGSLAPGNPGSRREPPHQLLGRRQEAAGAAVLVALRSRVRAPRPGPVQSLTARGHYLVLDLPGAEPRPAPGALYRPVPGGADRPGQSLTGSRLSCASRGPAPTKARGPRSLPRSDPSPARPPRGA